MFCLYPLSLSGFDPDSQNIFFRRDRTGKFFIVCAGGAVGHVEIQDHPVSGEDLGIDVPSPFIRLLSVG